LLVSASFRTKHEMKKILCGVLTRTTISGAGHARTEPDPVIAAILKA